MAELKREVIRSLDEIPEFASEDDEREWWATHEFSDELYEQLKPTPEEKREMDRLLSRLRRSRKAAS